MYAHQNHGSIFVKVEVGNSLDELHDVSINNPLDGQLLVYNSLSSVWVNSDAGLGGNDNYLPLSGGNLTGNLTVDGALGATGKLTNNNDIEITSLVAGLILKSPNGTRFRVTVDNSGALTTTVI